MKNTLKIIAGLLFISTMASASNRTSLEETKDDKSFKMGMYFDKASGIVNTFFEKQPGKMLLVSVIDNKGNELSTNTIGKKEDVTRLSLNVSSLVNGNYTIKVTDGSEVITKTISVEKVTPKKAKNFKMKVI